MASSPRPADNKTVRVFISSTFRDMHAERDVLVTVVFPALRERLERLGLDFFDVDLRWGVPETGVDGERANSWVYCKQWIDRVEPFFVCMLGQRYGWLPPANEIANEFDRAAYEGLSITEMEIRHAALRAAPRHRSFFYFRDAEVPPEPTTAPDVYARFVDASEQAKLDALKMAIEATDRPIRPYPSRWTGDGFTDLDAFGDLVLEDLWSGVLRDERYVPKAAWHAALGHDPTDDILYGDESRTVPEDVWTRIVEAAKPTPADPLDAEAQQMAAFAATRLRWFRGRGHELEQLQTFVEEPQPADASRVCVVQAAAGTGKSALLAKLADDLASSSHLVLSHFVGATERSADARSLLERLVKELDRNATNEAEFDKFDLESLKRRLASRLEAYSASRRIVLIIDGVNQLTDGHDLAWLPSRLGESVRVVLSCIDAAGAPETSAEARVAAAVARRVQAPKVLPLLPLTESDVREIVRDFLLEYCKELDRAQQDTIARMPAARNPLYLFVMLHELRTLGGEGMHLKVRDILAELPNRYPETISLFDWMLQRLEVFGEEDAKRWWIYLSLGRVGMSGRELRALLQRALGDEGARAALKIERSVRRYLQRRGAQWDFFHGQLREAVVRRYGPPGPVSYHVDIAEYLETLWRQKDVHAINELPHHETRGEMWPQVEQTLCDLTFVEAKCADGMIFDLVRDYTEALEALPEARAELQERREQQQRVASWTAAVIHFAQASSERRAREGRGEPVEVDGPSLVEAPATCRIRTDEEIAAETKRIEDRPTTRDRIAAFASFVRSECYALLRFSGRTGFVAQQARNHAPAGPVHAAARLVTRPTDSPSIRKHWRPDSLSVPTPALVATLEGHQGPVRSLAMTPDGRLAVSGSRDQTLRVWDLVTGECVRTLDGHAGSVASVAVTPDGRCAVSGGDDHTVRVWEVATGACVCVLEGHANAVSGVAVTPDGGRAVFSGKDHTVQVWDLATRGCLHIMEGHTGTVCSVAVTADGRRAVSVSRDQSLRVWDLNTGAALRTILASGGSTQSVAVAADGRRAVSGCSRDVRVWNIDTGELLRTLSGHSDSVTCVAITPDGGLAVSTSDDQSLRVWNLDTGECLRTLSGHSSEIESVSISADGSRALSAGYDIALRFWNLASGGLQTRLGHTLWVERLGLLAGGRLLESAGRDRKYCVWDLNTGLCVRSLSDHGWYAPYVGGASVARDGRLAVLPTSDCRLGVWDLAVSARVRTLEGHVNVIRSTAFAPHGRQVVSGGDDFTVRIWDVETGECSRVLEGHVGGVTSVDVTPDGLYVLSASTDKTVRVWDLASGVCLRVLRGHEEWVESVSGMPGRRWAVTASRDKTVRVWDLETSDLLALAYLGSPCTATAAVDEVQIVVGTGAGDVWFLDVMR